MVSWSIAAESDQRLAMPAILLPDDLDLARAIAAADVDRSEFVRHRE